MMKLYCDKLVEAGRVWSEDETKTLLEIWSKESIQRQLHGGVRNSRVYTQVAKELLKCGFLRTVPQC